MKLLEIELKESKSELARKLNIPPQFLDQILKGKRFLPSDKAAALLELGYSQEAVRELLSPKDKTLFDVLTRKTPAGVR
ncbi:CENP-B N-terminal DNA-binding domain-containing protein [Balnearium lithotrophicum]|uniref:CENP-B N-terminal DNA-binding domain-containing protein n=1 Tax=Balnearium lithotrophicum TaxID=223788 RepID=A0A521CSN7_9BACT|nr:hypothetical protein [Balnearium lithotrophicum]SMO61660.1 CENP-B N-terminal DNA-binding domain-containing protein [Balnearium lithotrophicum]